MVEDRIEFMVPRRKILVGGLFIITGAGFGCGGQGPENTSNPASRATVTPVPVDEDYDPIWLVNKSPFWLFPNWFPMFPEKTLTPNLVALRRGPLKFYSDVYTKRNGKKSTVLEEAEYIASAQKTSIHRSAGYCASLARAGCLEKEPAKNRVGKLVEGLAIPSQDTVVGLLVGVNSGRKDEEASIDQVVDNFRLNEPSKRGLYFAETNENGQWWRIIEAVSRDGSRVRVMDQFFGKPMKEFKRSEVGAIFKPIPGPFQINKLFSNWVLSLDRKLVEEIVYGAHL